MKEIKIPETFTQTKDHLDQRELQEVKEVFFQAFYQDYISIYKTTPDILIKFGDQEFKERLKTIIEVENLDDFKDFQNQEIIDKIDQACKSDQALLNKKNQAIENFLRSTSQVFFDSFNGEVNHSIGLLKSSEDQSVIGFATYRILEYFNQESNQHEQIGYISQFAIDPKFQGQKLSLEIVKAIAVDLNQKEVGSLTTIARRSNQKYNHLLDFAINEIKQYQQQNPDQTIKLPSSFKPSDVKPQAYDNQVYHCKLVATTNQQFINFIDHLKANLSRQSQDRPKTAPGSSRASVASGTPRQSL